MNPQNSVGSNSRLVSNAASDAEATLRLIASLPAPEGLEKRVIAGVRSAPQSGRVLGWPTLLNPTENWFRSVAAAAIVSVILGGGWGVYSRIQPISAIVAAPSGGAAGAFSNAGAVRVPQTVPAPVIAKPTPVQPSAAVPAKKIHGQVAPGAHRAAKGAGVSKNSVSPSATVAR